MILKCKLATRTVEEVELPASARLYELLDKLGITDKDTKFTFNQRTYSMASIQTFQEIGLANGGNIVVFNQAISGN
jgi:hypothetical protein